MLSRRSFLIGINSLALAPCTFSMTSEQALLPLTAPELLTQQTEYLLSDAPLPIQFKVYGWNADQSDETDPNTAVICLSNMWRSGWL